MNVLAVRDSAHLLSILVDPNTQARHICQLVACLLMNDQKSRESEFFDIYRHNKGTLVDLLSTFVKIVYDRRLLMDWETYLLLVHRANSLCNCNEHPTNEWSVLIFWVCYVPKRGDTKKRKKPYFSDRCNDLHAFMLRNEMFALARTFAVGAYWNNIRLEFLASGGRYIDLERRYVTNDAHRQPELTLFLLRDCLLEDIQNVIIKQGFSDMDETLKRRLCERAIVNKDNQVACRMVDLGVCPMSWKLRHDELFLANALLERSIQQLKQISNILLEYDDGHEDKDDDMYYPLPVAVLWLIVARDCKVQLKSTNVLLQTEQASYVEQRFTDDDILWEDTYPMDKPETRQRMLENYEFDGMYPFP